MPVPGRKVYVSQYCRLAGIVTGHPEKAARWQKDYNIPQKNIYNYQNFDEIVKNKDIDVVYVVLPNSMHKDFVIRAARAGKHVITEKPMAVSVKECEEMIDACNKAGVQLAVGYRLHYEPTQLEIKRLGQQKVFGQVRLIEASLGFKAQEGWRLHKSLAGGGPLMDVGIYCIQSSRYVLGEEPISVTAQFGPITNKTLFSEVEETVTWQMQFPGGAVANSTCSYGFSIDRFFASADNGSFELSPGLGYGPFIGKTTTGLLNLPPINQQAAQLDGIGKLILANEKLPSHITGEEANERYPVSFMQSTRQHGRAKKFHWSDLWDYLACIFHTHKHFRFIDFYGAYPVLLLRCLLRMVLWVQPRNDKNRGGIFRSFPF